MPLPNYAKRMVFRVLRLGFRLVPMSVSTRDRLRQRFLERHADLVPAGPRGHSAATHREYRARQRAAERAIGYREPCSQPLPAQLPAKLVAFYLPQFHAIPENDTWWGKGFTEWHNVTRALPQFEGHVQPRLPADLGFYDLSSPSAMRQQMELAQRYGIGAFCTYFYWFAGKTLLESPLQQWLEDASLQLPVCLCWANENWSRRWDGRADQILIGQQHSADDDLAFIQYVARYLREPRYLRSDGKPVLLVYRPGLLPEPKATAQRWRQWCREHGVGELHLGYVQSFDRVDPREIGFDFAVAFPPNNVTLKPITAQQTLLNPAFRGDIYDWRELARQSATQPAPAYPWFPCVNPGWDNEPRRSGAGRIFLHASPRGYRDWLRAAIDISRQHAGTSAMVFINAWNEWAEGAVLEPDMRLGHAWLNATRQALVAAAEHEKPTTSQPCAVIHAWHADALADVVANLRASGIDWRVIVTCTPELAGQLKASVSQLEVRAEVKVFDARGRDLFAFLHVADQLLDEGTELVLKLEAGEQRNMQDAWLPAQRQVEVFEAFGRMPALGIVATAKDSHEVDGSSAELRYLARRLGEDAPSGKDVSRLPQGTFWARLAALRPLLDAQLEPWEFENETGRDGDAFADAVARIIASSAVGAAYTVMDETAFAGSAPKNPET